MSTDDSPPASDTDTTDDASRPADGHAADGSDASGQTATGSEPPRRFTGWVGIAVIGILALAVGGSAGLLIGAQVPGTDPPIPGPDSADVGFARDMQMHHDQAVEMSVLLRDRTNDPDIRSIALDIELTQQQQIGQMYAWLDLWGYPQSSPGDSMAWMAHDQSGNQEDSDQDHDHSEHGDDEHGSDTSDTAAMPGMATPDEMRQLREASGQEAEQLFLRLMIEHHRGGIDMAQHAVDHAERPEIRQAAKTMVDAQESEITIMQRMLRDQDSPPED